MRPGQNRASEPVVLTDSTELQAEVDNGRHGYVHAQVLSAGALASLMSLSKVIILLRLIKWTQYRGTIENINTLQ
jgi:hypothetical protein